MDFMLNDFRLAFRSLAAKPSLTMVAVLTLALGVGANTAIFSVVHGVLLRPLGFSQEERLYALVANHESRGTERPGNALPDYWHWRDHQSSFEELTFYGWNTMTLEEPGLVQQLEAVYVGENIFRMLGLEPHLGRVLAAEDAEPGRGHVAVVSHELWQRLWNGDPDVVGRTVRIDREVVTIVGVMPPSTALPLPEAELWVPVGEVEDQYGRFGRTERDFIVLGRLGLGVTREAAQAELDRLAADIAADFPATNHGWGVRVEPLREYLVGSARSPILIAFGAVALVLLIACTNIAHLLLVRAAGREREMAVRAALGAGRGRLVRQLLTESLVLALFGGALGALAAVWLHDLLLALEPGILPRTHAIELDTTVLLFALAATLVTGLGCGLVPALRSSAVLLSSLREGGRRSLGHRRHRRWRYLLLGAEIALALVLLTGAGLLIRALYDLGRIDPGFEPSGTYTAHVVLDDGVYNDLDKRRVYFKHLHEKVGAIPGVESAALSTTPPVPNLGIRINVPYRGDDGPPLTPENSGEAPTAALRVVTPGYFETVGIPVVLGRDFTDHDDETAPSVAVVNRTLAGRLWPDQNPVGRRIRIFFGGIEELEVVGVVGDTRFAGLHVAPRPAVFFTHPQLPFMGMGVVARTGLAPAVFEEALRRAALEIDPLQPMGDVRSLEHRLERSVGVERFFAVVLSVFAVLALVLAAAGIYGVFSYWVSQRTSEIGVRMALGAHAGQIQRQVVGQGLAVTLVGLAVGLVGALSVTRLLASSFHGVTAIDLQVLASVSVVLASVALLSCFLPARRASRIEPNVALRSE